MRGSAFVVKRIEFQPIEIKSISRRPNDRCNASLCEMKIEQWVTHAFRIRPDDTRFGLLRHVELMGTGIVIGFVQHREIISITPLNGFGQIRCKVNNAIFIVTRTANQRHAALGKFTKIDRLPAMRATHRDCYMLGCWIACRCIPFSQDTQPPYKITPAIPTRWSIMWAN